MTDTKQAQGALDAFNDADTIGMAVENMQNVHKATIRSLLTKAAEGVLPGEPTEKMFWAFNKAFQEAYKTDGTHKAVMDGLRAASGAQEDRPCAFCDGKGYVVDYPSLLSEHRKTLKNKIKVPCTCNKGMELMTSEAQSEDTD